VTEKRTVWALLTAATALSVALTENSGLALLDALLDDDRDEERVDGAGSERGGDLDGAVGSTHAWNLGAAEGFCSRYLR
jgi:hypothetical protein